MGERLNTVPIEKWPIEHQGFVSDYAEHAQQIQGLWEIRATSLNNLVLVYTKIHGLYPESFSEAAQLLEQKRELYGIEKGNLRAFQSNVLMPLYKSEMAPYLWKGLNPQIIYKRTIVNKVAIYS